MSQKHALIFFTKVPTPGLTKTRLTEERGGILTPEEAADFYHAVMLDTAQVGFRALEQLNCGCGCGCNVEPRDQYDFYVCATPQEDHPRLKEIFDAAGPWPSPVHFIADQGKDFNEHFHDAFQQMWQLGYHSAVAIGGDQPQMSVSNIVQAFQWLKHFDETKNGGGLVHCPCQACGVSLVGMTKTTPMDFQGVFYNTEGVSALDAIINIATEHGIPIAALETVADIDNVEDLAHALTLARSQAYTSQFQEDVMVPHRFLAWAEKAGLQVATPPNTDHDPRELIDA